MPAQPLVSIIVPTFNQARYLPISLDSVMFQDYPDIEVIICNHGSTDDTSTVIRDFLAAVDKSEVSFLHHLDETAATKKLIRQYEPRYPQNRIIKVLESLENIGGTSSYNEGFKAATGKYCTYLVGDDLLLPTAISDMAACLESQARDFVYADMFVVDDQGRILQHLKKPEYSFQACFADWFHLGVCKLYRRALHDAAGFYDPNYRNANDYDMYLRFAMAGAKFQHLPKTLYCTRKHDPKNPDEPASWRNDGYSNLMRESILCAQRARRYQAEHPEVNLR